MKDINTIFNSALDASLDNRFCTHCHCKLVHHNNERYVFKCPICNVVTNIHNTEPTEKLVTTFPSQQNNGQPVEINKRFIYQNSKERIPRNQYFQTQRAIEKNKTEFNDPYLREMRKRQDITITNIDYYDPSEDE